MYVFTGWWLSMCPRVVTVAVALTVTCDGEPHENSLATRPASENAQRDWLFEPTPLVIAQTRAMAVAQEPRGGRGRSESTVLVDWVLEGGFLAHTSTSVPHDG